MKNFYTLFFFLVLTSTTLNLRASNEDIVWLKPGHSGAAKPWCASSDGKILVTASVTDYTVKVINTGNNALLVKFDLKDPIQFLKFSPNEDYLLAGVNDYDSKDLKLLRLDLSSGVISTEYSLDSTPGFLSLKISNDNRFMAAISPGSKAYCWDLSSGSLKYIFDIDNDNQALSLDFEPGKDRITIVTDITVENYNLSTGQLSKSIQSANPPTTKLLFNRDGSILTIYNYDGIVNYFSPDSLSLTGYMNTDDNLRQLIYTADEHHFLTIRDDNNYGIINIDSGKKIGEINQERLYDALTFMIGSVEVIATGTLNGKITLFDFNTLSFIKRLTNNYKRITFFNHGSNLLSMNTMVLESSSGNLLFETANQVDGIADTDLVYNTIADMIHFGSAAKGDNYDSIKFITDMYRFHFSDGAKLCDYISIDSSLGTNVMDWQTMTGIFNDTLADITYSHDCRYLAGFNIYSQDFKVIDLHDSSVIYKIPGGAIKTVSCRFSPDDKYMVLREGTDSTRIIDLMSGILIGNIPNALDSGSVFYPEVCLSPDGKYYIDATKECVIRIWNIEAKKVAYSYPDYNMPLYSLDASLDTNYIIAGYTDGTAILYKTQYRELSVNPSVQTNSNEIKVYPNPAGEYINIEPGFICSHCNIIIYNTLGEIVLNKTIETSSENIKLSVYDFPNGTYLINLRNGNKSNTAVFSVVR